MSVGIHGDIRASQAVAAASAQKVHHFLIGDSNTIKDGHGWDHGLQCGLVQRQQMFATGFVRPAHSGYAAPAGYGSAPSTYLWAASSGAPAELAAFAESLTGEGLGGVLQYGYLADGSTWSGGMVGMIISANWPGDISANLQWDGWWGSFDSGSGSFTPTLRKEEPGWNVLASGAPVSTNTGEKTINKTSLALPAAARDFAVGGGWNRSGGATVTGPLVTFWNRTQNTDRNKGFAFSTLLYKSGQSARSHALGIQNQGDAFYSELFGAARQDAIDEGQSPKIVFWLNSGLNDRNEGSASVGPAAEVDGDSAAAFYDNNLAMMRRIREVWDANGWPLSELNFVIVPSHPVSTPDDAELVSYREAAAYLATAYDRVVSVDISQIYTGSQFSSNAWYQASNTDTAHLEQIAYETVGTGVVDALLRHASDLPRFGLPAFGI